MVVRVLAMTAAATSRVPSRAACLGEAPPSFRRTMFSSTTIELSTSMPMPSARPPRDMMFRVKPPK